MTTITISATITSNIIKGGGGSQIPPSNLTAPVITGTGVVGQTLSVSDGTWAGSPIPTFSYQWKRDGVDIVGAIGNTYILDQPDATKVITCEVTATNIAGSASALSSNSLTILDADANAFITAANITNATQITAINVLTNDLKGYNIWSKMKAIYPFVGGTASTHKFNLKDPRDLDAAFRLVFNGGWTHSSTGALPNGTNAYADSFFSAISNLTNNNIHLSFYSRTQSIGNSGCDLGANDGGSISQYGIYLYYAGLSRKLFVAGSYPTDSIVINNTNTLGLQIGSRTANNSAKLYFNNNILGTLTTIYNNNLTSRKFFISASNNNGSPADFSNKQIAFATIGDGLTDTDATNLSWITEQYQTTLGRSVNPWYNNGNLLLDNYPSAAVAYSVRKLRNYYIGAAIRVRRSSDNAEQDIYFDSTGNLDTASLLSFVGAGNGFVTTWYDQSGNGRNVTQTTATAQPRIVNAGVLETQNGKPTLVYDGSNDSLFRANTNIFNNKNYGVAFVANRYISTPVTSARNLFFVSTGAGNVARFNIGKNTNSTYGLGARRLDSDTAQAIVTINTYGNTSMYLNTSIVDWGNSDAYIYINNNIEASSTTFLTNGSTSATNAYLAICSSDISNYSNANVSEVIAYESSQNISAINTNINSYFNIYP